MDETEKQPPEPVPPAEREDDVEAHGMKEGIAVGLGVAALAVPGASAKRMPDPLPGETPAAAQVREMQAKTAKQAKRSKAARASRAMQERFDERPDTHGPGPMPQ